MKRKELEEFKKRWEENLGGLGEMLNSPWFAVSIKYDEAEKNKCCIKLGQYVLRYWAQLHGVDLSPYGDKEITTDEFKQAVTKAQTEMKTDFEGGEGNAENNILDQLKRRLNIILFGTTKPEEDQKIKLGKNDLLSASNVVFFDELLKTDVGDLKMIIDDREIGNITGAQRKHAHIEYEEHNKRKKQEIELDDYYIMATENPFVKLFSIDFKDHVEVKKSGKTELKYVSWAYAWAEVKKLYPSASYEVKKFNGLPYVYDPITGFMVYTSVTIEGVSHEMWLPVLDGANKAMKAVPYTYTTPKWDYNPQTRRREKIGMEERTVEAASMFDVNKAIMRCLVKNLAMFGLGLYVYAGENLPEDAAQQPDAESQKQPKPKSTSQKQEQPPMPCICVRCNQPIKRVKLKDGSIMQAAEFANTHEGMCVDCYKATRLNVA